MKYKACIPSMRPLLRLLQRNIGSSTDGTTEARTNVHRRWWSEMLKTSSSQDNMFEMLGDSSELAAAHGPHTTITAAKQVPDQIYELEMPEHGIRVEQQITWTET